MFVSCAGSRRIAVFAVAFLLAGSPRTSHGQPRSDAPLEPPSPAELPAWEFVENTGQWSPEVRFAARRGRVSLALADDATYYRVIRPDLRGVTVRTTLVGASPAMPVGEQPTAHVRDYYVGAGPDDWVRGARSFRSVRVQDALPGVDLRHYDRDGLAEFDLILDADVDPRTIAVRVDGVADLHVDAQGALLLVTTLGHLRLTPPIAWTVGEDGREEPAPCRYRRIDAAHYGFDVEMRCGRELVIDPGLDASTFLGGLGSDACSTIARGVGDRMIVAGTTSGLDFPLSPGIFGLLQSDYNLGFVSTLSPDGAELRHTAILGGTDGDASVADIARHGDGSLFIVGTTSASDLPTTNGALDRTYNGAGLTHAGDAFVARLTADGSLLAATYLGGAHDDIANAVAIDPTEQHLVVVGTTYSSDFPVSPNAFDGTFSGSGLTGRDGFLARIDLDLGTLSTSTFVGGSGVDQLSDVALSRDGEMFVAGLTDSVDLPTNAASFAPSLAGGEDAFVARFDAGGATMLASTYLGGSSLEFEPKLAPQVDVDVTVVGATFSSDFPATGGSAQVGSLGGVEAFVTRLDRALSTVRFSTHLGGGGLDFALAATVDAAGETLVVGDTGSKDFPVTDGAYDTTFNGGDLAFPTDMFVTLLAADGRSVVYSTFLGGAMGDGARDVVRTPDGAALVAGLTQSVGFPVTPGAFQTTHGGEGEPYVGFDGVALRFDLTPTGVSKSGGGRTVSTGWASVSGSPTAGSAGLEITYTGAPTTNGLLVLTAGDEALATPVTADPDGTIRVPTPLTGLAAGDALDAKFVFADRTTSETLEITVQ